MLCALECFIHVLSLFHPVLSLPVLHAQLFVVLGFTHRAFYMFFTFFKQFLHFLHFDILTLCVQKSSFPETFNDIHSCVGSVPEHFRVVCDLESSLRLGHMHIDRLSSMATVPLNTARAQDTVIHTHTCPSW